MNKNSPEKKSTDNALKAKRFYIVLLCCIMIVGITYITANSFKTPPAEKKQNITLSPSSTPLPDLTKGFPENMIETTPSYDNSSYIPRPSSTPQVSEIIEEDTEYGAVNAQTDTEYTSRTKSSLSYPLSGEIITPHSGETLIYSKTLGDWRIHSGIDIKSQISTEVHAADEGIVESVTDDDLMGISIVINHENGLKTLYANLSNASLVKVGQRVNRGDVISTVGDSAISETAEVGHLHFEVFEDGESVEPTKWLAN